MRASLVALLLFATAAHAQWVSPIEETYGPYVRPLTGGRPALAASTSRVLLAWSEGAPARIHTGVLNFSARLVTPIEILPPATAESLDSLMPAAASDGSSFFVVWAERQMTSRVLRGAPVSADGVAGTARTYGTVVTLAWDQLIVPAIVWDGSNYRAFSGSSIYTIAPDGELRSSQRANTGEVGAAGSNGVIATAQSLHQPLWTCCNLENVDLRWQAGALSGRTTIVSRRPRDANNASTPSVAATGTAFVFAWSTFDSIGYLRSNNDGPVPTNVSAFARLDVSPGLACDDDVCLIAYGSLGDDVHAIAFEPDDPRGPVIYPIVASERKERAPQVVALGLGRFLVAYLSDQGGQQWLAGRIVLAKGFPKKRSVRP